jgi:uncharacterized protein YjbI with pentapeptide repeats
MLKNSGDLNILNEQHLTQAIHLDGLNLFLLYEKITRYHKALCGSQTHMMNEVQDQRVSTKLWKHPDLQGENFTGSDLQGENFTGSVWASQCSRYQASRFTS